MSLGGAVGVVKIAKISVGAKGLQQPIRHTPVIDALIVNL